MTRFLKIILIFQIFLYNILKMIVLGLIPLDLEKYFKKKKILNHLFKL